jgi:hypothetical protein
MSEEAGSAMRLATQTHGLIEAAHGAAVWWFVLDG